MRTGVVTTSFPGHAGDFAGCFVEDDVHALVAAGETVDVIAPGGAAAGDRLDLAPAVRVLRTRMPMSMPGASSSMFLAGGAPEALERGGAGVWTQAAFCWAGLCEETRRQARSWDRIVAHWLMPCALIARAVAPALPLTAYAHGGDVALLERIPGGASIGRRLARETDDLIFVSADLRNRFARLTGIRAGRVARIATIAAIAPLTARDSQMSPTFATFATVTPLARRAAQQAFGVRGRVVLSVGRLVPIKGFDVLLRAVAILNAADRTQDDAPPTVVILGEGSERARLEDMACRLNIDLRLPGVVPRPDVAGWMSRADLYVQPSRRLASGRTEGLPTATREALSLGLPVIASATGGLIELAENRGAAVMGLVPADNPGALATAMFDWMRRRSPSCPVWAQSA